MSEEFNKTPKRKVKTGFRFWVRQNYSAMLKLDYHIVSCTTCGATIIECQGLASFTFLQTEVIIQPL